MFSFRSKESSFQLLYQFLHLYKFVDGAGSISMTRTHGDNRNAEASRHLAAPLITIPSASVSDMQDE